MRRAINLLQTFAILLLAGGFFASAYYLYTVYAYSLAGSLALVGAVCVALAIDLRRENNQ